MDLFLARPEYVKVLGSYFPDDLPVRRALSDLYWAKLLEDDARLMTATAALVDVLVLERGMGL